MGFISFTGRVLFSTIFILVAWQRINDFDADGGAIAKAAEPKLALFRNHVNTLLGLEIPEVEIKYLVMAAIALEGLGGVLFIFGCTLGACMLLVFLAVATPIMHDFYNNGISKAEGLSDFIQFLKNLSLCGALVFFMGMKNSFVKKPTKKIINTKTN